jgi:hypothetical protein
MIILPIRDLPILLMKRHARRRRCLLSWPAIIHCASAVAANCRWHF